MAAKRIPFPCRSILFCVMAGAAALAQVDLNQIHIPDHRGATVLASATTAPDPALGSDPAVIRRTVDMVLVPVSVTDALNRPVTGLTKENFQVFEGKLPQQIKNFSSEDAPISIGLIMDSSRSMRDKMESVRDAVAQFCRDANPQDQFFLISFSDRPQLAQDFTQQTEAIQAKLPFVASQGRTALLDAIYMGLSKLKEARYSRKALLIISDGGDNYSRYTEREVQSLVREADAMIYAIGIFDQYVTTEEEMRGPELLSEIAEETGAQSFTLENPNDLPAVVSRIGFQMRNQYVLAYRPEDTPQDGKWHKIKIKLKMPRNLSLLRLHAKSGYYAGKP